MNPFSPFEFRGRAREFATVVRLPLVFIILASAACSHNSESRTHLEWKVLPDPIPAKEPEHKPRLPDCPEGDSEKLKRGSPQTGHHRVTLTWNASAAPSNDKNADIGYCLYRSKNHPVRKPKTRKSSDKNEQPPCEKCEQVNVRPILQTGCVDNLVKDGTTYYYVAIAINNAKSRSVFSNQAPAPIPGSRTPAKSTPASSYPMCRDNDSPKSPSAADLKDRRQ